MRTRTAWICLPAAILSAFAGVIAPARGASAPSAWNCERNEAITLDLADGRAMADSTPAPALGESVLAIRSPASVPATVITNVETTVPTTPRDDSNTGAFVRGAMSILLMIGLFRVFTFGWSSNPVPAR